MEAEEILREKRQLLRQKIINILWSYEDLSEYEIEQIADKIINALKEL